MVVGSLPSSISTRLALCTVLIRGSIDIVTDLWLDSSSDRISVSHAT